MGAAEGPLVVKEVLKPKQNPSTSNDIKRFATVLIEKAMRPSTSGLPSQTDFGATSKSKG